MKTNIPADIISSLRNRQTLLWLCQRHELKPGENPHSPERHPDELTSIYRDGFSELDKKIASIFWEAIWTDAVKGVLLSAINSQTSISSTKKIRHPIVLAADPDQDGQIDTRQLLPLYFINGLIDHLEEGGRYDGKLTLRRSSYRINSLRKLEDYPNRYLIILGAESQDDVEGVFDALSNFSPVGLRVCIVWSDTNNKIKIPKEVKVPIFFFEGTTETFIDELLLSEIPEAGFSPKYSLLTNNGIVSFEETDLFGIMDYFDLIFEKDLILPDAKYVSRETFEEFISGVEGKWIGYAAQFAFERQYKPNAESNEDLTSFIEHKLIKFQTQSDTPNLTLTIPAQAGSGVTTTLRQVAYNIAQKGYPSLLLKQNQVAFNFEAIAAFLNSLQQKTQKNTPVVLFFDSNHELIEETYEISQLLSTRGRSVITVRVENPVLTNFNGSFPFERRESLKVRGKHIRLQSLNGQIDDQELSLLRDHFLDIAQKYKLDIEVPDLQEWVQYQEAQKFTSIDYELGQPESLFWVALHFFLFSRGLPPEGFEVWIRKFYESLATSQLRELVKRVAVLSSFRLVTPLVPLLRSFGQDNLSGDALDAISVLAEDTKLIVWDSPKSLEDQVIRFSHPLIAQKLLSLTDNSISNYPVEILWPLISSLKGGNKSDIWLAENLTFQFLKTEKRQGKRIPFLDKRLDTFRRIPPQISEYNKAVLHHWSRALYHAALETEDPITANSYLQEAIDKIEKAIDLPPHPEKDEHPGHLYTTLGTIYYEVYRRKSSNQIEAISTEKSWSNSEDSFKKAMKLLPDSYQTLAAYAHRLIEKSVITSNTDAKLAVDFSLNALSLLQQAEDIAISSNELGTDETYFLGEQRRRAWNVIDPLVTNKMIDDFIEQKEEVGYLLYTQNKLKEINEIYSIKSKKELKIVEECIDVLASFLDHPSSIYSWRAPYFLYRLYDLHIKLKYSFKEKLTVLRKLEKTDYQMHIKLSFDYAVLCYQNELFLEGEKRFRAIRAVLRQPNQSAKSLKDFWRTPGEGDKPRSTVMKVRRKDSDWRGYCYVEELGQEIPFRPRAFDIPPKVGEYRPCKVSFQTWGPIAVPKLDIE